MVEGLGSQDLLFNNWAYFLFIIVIIFVFIFYYLYCFLFLSFFCEFDEGSSSQDHILFRQQDQQDEERKLLITNLNFFVGWSAAGWLAEWNRFVCHLVFASFNTVLMESS